MINYITAFVLLFGLYSCDNHEIKSQLPINDTTEILKLALMESISDSSMPDASSSINKSPSGDTVIITTSLIPFDKVPSSVGGVTFKVLPDSLICETLDKSKGYYNTPRYLDIRRFEKTDTTYYLHIICISCGQFPSGGLLALNYQKINNVFILKHKGSSSIN